MNQVMMMLFFFSSHKWTDRHRDCHCSCSTRGQYITREHFGYHCKTYSQLALLIRDMHIQGCHITSMEEHTHHNASQGCFNK